MTGRVTIGEFSTMTRLSRKALRHYHDLGLLEPADVDPATGYRYYDIAQIELARLIRRFRDLDMPVPDLKSYVAAPDDARRSEIVSAHLDRMEQQLRRTQGAVEALRELLSGADSSTEVEIRDAPWEQAVAIIDTVRLDDIGPWWNGAARALDRALRRAGAVATGPLSGQYDHALFSDEEGEATLWFPASGPIPESGRVRMTQMPAGRFAVAVHAGPDERIDETYAALGTYVTERGIGAAGPVRERYLAGVLDDPSPLVTEVAWPVHARPVTVRR